MRILETAKDILHIAAVIIVLPLAVLFIALCLIYCAILDCLGLIKDPGNAMREEW